MQSRLLSWLTGRPETDHCHLPLYNQDTDGMFFRTLRSDWPVLSQFTAVPVHMHCGTRSIRL
jgi:hypothetical protein